MPTFTSYLNTLDKYVCYIDSDIFEMDFEITMDNQKLRNTHNLNIWTPIRLPRFRAQMLTVLCP